MDTVNNTHYQKLFNEDLKPSGKLFGLSNAQFRAIVILRARCDTNGVVHDELNKPYSVAKLSVIMGINERTARVVLIELSKLNLIEETADGIYVKDFGYDMVARGTGNGSVRRERAKKGLLAALQENTSATKDTREVANFLNTTIREYIGTSTDSGDGK